MPPRHYREAIAAFIDGEFRQFWAVDRTTGAATYIPNVQVELLRSTAKSEWRCPVPERLVEITTVGGSRDTTSGATPSYR